MPMRHKGVEYSIRPVEAGVYQWRALIGDKELTGKIETRLELLAQRRVQLRIDTALKKIARDHFQAK